jgi:rod shape-determining protein MreC
VEKKRRAILVFCVLLVAVSLLLKLVPTKNIPQEITLSLAKFPLRLVSLSFLPADSLIYCRKSLKQVSLLEKENQQLKLRLMQLQESERENNRLRQLLSFKNKANFNIVTAEVISFDSSNFRNSIVIDKGKKDGIKIGNPVVTAQGAVGTVVRVGILASQAVLINDTEFSMAVKVTRSNASGILSGSLAGNCKIRYLDLDEDIQAGDEVISLGQNSRFPAGIVVGTVTEVSKEQSGLTLFAMVKPKVKVSSLQEVLVITNY